MMGVSEPTPSIPELPLALEVNLKHRVNRIVKFKRRTTMRNPVKANTIANGDSATTSNRLVYPPDKQPEWEGANASVRFSNAANPLS